MKQLFTLLLAAVLCVSLGASMRGLIRAKKAVAPCMKS